MTVTLALHEFLAHHGLSAYRLEMELKGQLNRNSVYALAKPGGVTRVDLDTLGKVLPVLSALVRRPVQIGELFQVTEGPAHELRRSGAGLPYTGDRVTNEILDAHPDLLDRLAEAERA